MLLTCRTLGIAGLRIRESGPCRCRDCRNSTAFRGRLQRNCKACLYPALSFVLSEKGKPPPSAAAIVLLYNDLCQLPPLPRLLRPAFHPAFIGGTEPAKIHSGITTPPDSAAHAPASLATAPPPPPHTVRRLARMYPQPRRPHNLPLNPCATMGNGLDPHFSCAPAAHPARSFHSYGDFRHSNASRHDHQA